MPTEISGSTGVNKIQDNTIVNADINSSAAIAGSKLVMPTGSVLQVKSLVYATDTSFTSSTFTNTGFSLAITPSSTSSKIYVMWQSEVTVQGDTNFGMRLLKDSTQIYEPFVSAGNFGSSNQHGHSYSFNFLDSPSTTSSITYTVQVKKNSGNSVRCPAEGGDGTITLMEIAG